MVAATLLSIAAALYGLSAAAPSPSAVGLSDRGSGYEIHQLKPRAAEHAVIRLATTYARFNTPLPEHMKAAVSRAKFTKRAAGAVNLTLNFGSEYLTPITIGNQVFHLGFDSVTADLWVYYTTGSGLRYAPSSSSKRLNGGWSATYDGGPTVKGVLFSDTVQVGGATVTAQTVQAATSAPSSFINDVKLEGLFGFAFSGLNTASPQAKTVFDNLLGTLDKPVFTADLRSSTPGVFGVGFIDSSRYTGSVVYAPLSDQQGFWTISFSGFGVGSTYKSAATPAMVSTLDYNTLLPDQTVKDYYAKVSGSGLSTSYGGWIFPCSAALPTFALAINGTYFTVPGSYINAGSLDSTNSRCFGALQSSKGLGYSVVGNSFLKGVFVVFDRGTNISPTQPKVGFANKVL